MGVLIVRFLREAPCCLDGTTTLGAKQEYVVNELQQTQLIGLHPSCLVCESPFAAFETQVKDCVAFFTSRHTYLDVSRPHGKHTTLPASTLQTTDPPDHTLSVLETTTGIRRLPAHTHTARSGLYLFAAMLNLSSVFSVSFRKRERAKALNDTHHAGQVATPEQPSARQHQEQKNQPNSDASKPQRSGRWPWTMAEEPKARTASAQVDGSLAQLSRETSEMQRKLRSASRTPEPDAEEMTREQDRESLKLLEVATAKQRRRQERTGVRAFVSTTTESEMAAGDGDWTIVSQDEPEQPGEVSGSGSFLAISNTNTSARALQLPEHHTSGLVLEEQHVAAGTDAAFTTSSAAANEYHFTPSDSSSDTSTTPSQAASRALRREHWQQDDDPRFASPVESLREGRKERVRRRISGDSLTSETLLDAMHDWAPSLVLAYMEIIGRKDKLIDDLYEQLLKVEGQYEELRRVLRKASKPSKLYMAGKKARAERKLLAEKALLAEQALLAEDCYASSDVAEQASAPRDQSTATSPPRGVGRAVAASAASERG